MKIEIEEKKQDKKGPYLAQKAGANPDSTEVYIIGRSTKGTVYSTNLETGVVERVDESDFFRMKPNICVQLENY
jgi:hypothetical protein